MALHSISQEKEYENSALRKSMRTIFWDAEGCITIVIGTRESHECCLLPSDTSGASLCTS